MPDKRPTLPPGATLTVDDGSPPPEETPLVGLIASLDAMIEDVDLHRETLREIAKGAPHGSLPAEDDLETVEIFLRRALADLRRFSRKTS